MTGQPSIANLSRRARQAYRVGDSAAVARVLTQAAQRTGLAWRTFERRLASSLERLAERRLDADRPFAVPEGTRPEACGVRVLVDDPGLCIRACRGGHFLVDLGPVSLRLDRDRLEQLYLGTGDALAQLALDELREYPRLRLVEGEGP